MYPWKDQTILQTAVLEYRKFKADNYKKWKSEWLTNLKRLRKEKGSNVMDENGRTVGEFITNTETSTRLRNTIKLLPTVTENLYARFSVLKKIIKEEMKKEQWQTVKDIMKE